MDICSICLEDNAKILFKTECKHYFHKDCLIKWLRKNMTCPLCRKEIKSIDSIYNENNLINRIYKFTDFLSVKSNTFEINGIKFDNISEQLTNQSPYIWVNGNIRGKTPIYYLKNNYNNVICIDFYTRQLILFSKMNSKNLVKNTTDSIYYSNTDNLELDLNLGVVISYKNWTIICEWMYDVVNLLSEKYDFVFEDCINTLIMDIIIITINENKITNKSLFQTIVISSVYNIILYLKKIELSKSELIWLTDNSSKIENFEKFSKFQKNNIEKNIILLN